MKHDYEKRKQNRINKAKQLAEKNVKKAGQLYKQANKMSSVIPFGQPILVGHHSEKRDRRYRARIRNTFDKSFEAGAKAEFYDRKAASIEDNMAISSDDPQAITKLEKELQNLIARHDFMKAANQCIRKNDKTKFLTLDGATEQIWQQVTNEKYGFTGFNLSRSNANIKLVREQIAELKKVAGRQTAETIINGVRLVSNVEANRVQLFFQSRVSNEVYAALRKNGFVWCRSEGAFQRQLKSYAITIAKELLEKFETYF